MFRRQIYISVGYEQRGMRITECQRRLRCLLWQEVKPWALGLAAFIAGALKQAAERVSLAFKNAVNEKDIDSEVHVVSPCRAMLNLPTSKELCRLPLAFTAGCEGSACLLPASVQGWRLRGRGGSDAQDG